jgi:hypothetical protein
MRTISCVAAGRPVGRCRFLVVSVFILSLIVSPFSTRADTNALRMINLTGGIAAYNGSGVNVGQIEPGTPANHVDFDVANKYNIVGPANTSDHATSVASVMISTGLVTMGVSTGATLYATSVNNYPSDDAAAWQMATQNVAGAQACKVINMSFGTPNGGYVPPVSTNAGTKTIYYNLASNYSANGNDSFSQTLDNIAANNYVIFVKSAGNNGLVGTNTITDPGAAYNIITVGSVSNTPLGTATGVASSSSRGYLSDGRSDPDIVAPGANVAMAALSTNVTLTRQYTEVFSNNTGTAITYPIGSTYTTNVVIKPIANPPTLYNTNSGTSFAAPMVSGVAARLVQYGNTLPPVIIAAATDPRTIKAVLLNSATKLTGWGQGVVQGTGAPVPGLTGSLTGKVWTATQQGDISQVTQPLDPNQGAGLLNANGSYLQLAANGGMPGKPLFTNSNIRAGGNVGLTGWDFNTVSMNMSNVYRVLPTQAQQGTLALTLVWNRDVTTGVDAGTNINVVGGMANLSLNLYYSPNNLFTNGTPLIASSYSIVDNIEHLWFTNAPAAYYDFGVGYNGYTGTLNPPTEQYALAWSFTAVPEPSTFLLAGLGMTALAWRLRRKRT